MSNKVAFITGITGQDGSFLAQHLLDLNYKVYGGIRRTSTQNLWRLQRLDIIDKVKLLDFDLLEYSNMYSVLKEVMPDEVYNLAAMSFVGTSFKQPLLTAEVDGLATLKILDILKSLKPDTKFYQASTSEMFGKVQETPQKETTSFYPRSPYGVAKLYAHWMTVNYRESYDMYALGGILFNHESELRGPEFVTRKVTMTVARRQKGSKEVLEIGNMESKRDWGYAKEYVQGMHLMLQAQIPEEYILATGVTTTVKKFIEMSFLTIGNEIIWEGEGQDEKGYDSKTHELLVRVNPEFYRPAEVDLLVGDPAKANIQLGWKAKVDLSQLADIMVKSDIAMLK